MTIYVVVALCVMLLMAYVFDLSAPKTKIPSVILLLIMGGLARFAGLKIPDLSDFLPALGTLGLILIVLEGSLELELNRSKTKLIVRSFLVALLPMIMLSVLAAFVLDHYTSAGYRVSLMNVIPLFVVSSAIAIPSVTTFRPANKDFVIYETSMSDIIGVMLFNFIVVNEFITFTSFQSFFVQFIALILVSFVATLVLAFLLGNINHRVKFLPLVLAVVLIYTVSKIYHLPSLLFILLFGLFLSNFNLFKNFRFAKRLNPEFLVTEVHKFGDLVSEFAFLVRSLFFLVFGFLINPQELLDTSTMATAIGICVAIYAVRALVLKLVKAPLKPLTLVSPRGLITILLFLSIPPHQMTPYISKTLITQVIVISVIAMMVGLMWHRPKDEEDEELEGVAQTDDTPSVIAELDNAEAAPAQAAIPRQS